jgi:hypothetical protein
VSELRRALADGSSGADYDIVLESRSVRLQNKGQPDPARDRIAWRRNLVLRGARELGPLEVETGSPLHEQVV